MTQYTILSADNQSTVVAEYRQTGRGAIYRALMESNLPYTGRVQGVAGRNILRPYRFVSIKVAQIEASI